jgi:FtsH-binding integral membrane protein
MSDVTYALTNTVAVRERSVLKTVYIWMTVGLATTGIVAHLIASNEQIWTRLFSNTGVFIGICVAQLVMVLILSALIMKMNVGLSILCFGVYAVLTGITMSAIFLTYTSESIARTFFITAGTFAGLSLYAVTTKRDLSSWGSYLLMALIGLIIASVVNFFLKSSALEWIITFAGVVIFVGLTVYDTQKIKKWNEEVGENADETLVMRLSIMGALSLYLDFINLFLYLLRIFGRRR